MLVKAYKEIVPDELRQLYPNVHRGLSVRSIRRYVVDHNMTYHDKQLAVEEAVQEVSEKKYC